MGSYLYAFVSVKDVIFLFFLIRHLIHLIILLSFLDKQWFGLGLLLFIKCNRSGTLHCPLGCHCTFFVFVSLWFLEWRNLISPTSPKFLIIDPSPFWLMGNKEMNEFSFQKNIEITPIEAKVTDESSRWMWLTCLPSFLYLKKFACLPCSYYSFCTMLEKFQVRDAFPQVRKSSICFMRHFSLYSLITQ